MAKAPATCGDAIEVPLNVAVPVLLLCEADTMLEPGPNKSRQGPKFEYDARASLLSVAPTVNTVGSAAGEVLQALALSLPAATATATLASTRRRTASS